MRISRFSQQIIHWMSRSEEKLRKDLSWPQSESCCCCCCCCGDAILPRGRSLRPEAMAAGSVFFSWELLYVSLRGFPACGRQRGGVLFCFGLVGELLRFSYPLFLQLEGSF